MTAPTLAAVRMSERLTTPFARGADTLTLRLLPGADPSAAEVAPYDFTEHQSRFDRTPEPSYVLAAARDVAVDTTVTVTCTRPGEPPLTARATFPAGTVAGASVALGIPVSAQLRLTGLRTAPAAPDGHPDQAWRLTALLGNTAKVLWVLGGERDQLRGQFARTVAQRHLPRATGRSLDLIGADLGVPRFPPLPYGFDDATVALYHLDDVPGSTVAQDVTGQYPGRTGHPGSPKASVQRGAAGRYGAAFGFHSPDAVVEAVTDAAFDIAPTGSATVECFVRPDAGGGDGQVLFRHPAPGGAGAGWLLSVGEFGRGVARNPRLFVSDGTTPPLTLFADLSLPTDAFTHLAGVLDRTAGELRLHVDGVLRARAPLGGLGAVVNTAPLRIGPADSAFRGVIDEVRISATARTDFAPALGEADEHYRRRLRLFRRWALPTPANLAAMLNELVGTIGGRSDPLVVQDANATLVRGSRPVRIRPVALREGESIDAAGRRGANEADTVGTAQQEERFDPVFLLRYDSPAVDFTVPPPRDLDPGELPPDPHLVQVRLADTLNRLVTLGAAEPGAPGRLRIAAAFDPRAADLRATGRAVLLGHSRVAPGRLAALAHRAGFDFVRLRTDDRGDGASVYAACAPGDYFAVDLTPAPAGPTDLDVGRTAALTLRPAPPADSVLRWLTVPAGPGRATLTTSGVLGRPTSVTEIRADAPGGLIVKAEVTRGRHTVSASRPLRIGLPDLPDGGTIAADGTLGAPPGTVSDPDEFFAREFLVRHDDPRVNYGGDDNNHLMQPSVGRTLDALLAELDRRSTAGRLTVTSAFRPAGDEFGTHGRMLTLQHAAVPPGALAGLAHAVGFGHVTHTGATVALRQAPGDLVVVHGPDGRDKTPVVELDEGETLDLSVQPALNPDTPPGPGTGRLRLGWATGTFGTARVSLGNPKQSSTVLRGDSAGAAWVQASYLLGDLPAPYTFRVGLRPELDNPDTVISKDQYDLILNILNALHPVGIEVNTQLIRDHTVEVRGNLAEVNPDFTFPKFRIRSVLPPLRRDNTRG
ncbi:LamG domain-containing protein [Streptomyces sp. WI04-05B]|uniref:LamG domain-containing protein n=1 Tax=Streptomyces TaxID=1883 RepID=UPI0029BAFF34|nr:MULTISPECIES: LamG domain-containing protein [unclassified Streptomyces]MDX2547457.1 LamG domain-containing protein [Streptomyces sp. WI04-05B]MDX2586284.1 LamG domain-containing protein [Streptomyces sp. WI04-05A]MDX3748934.1 LamG domain-containing protein [Streptomyces sp. AK08-02]